MGYDINEKETIMTTEEAPMKFDWVEYYSGFKGEERPLAVYEGEKRIEVVKILWQKRIRDNRSGQIKELFRCQLADGRQVVVEKASEENTA